MAFERFEKAIWVTNWPSNARMSKPFDADDIMAVIANVTGTNTTTQLSYVTSLHTVLAQGAFSGFNQFGDPTAGTINSIQFISKFPSSLR